MDAEGALANPGQWLQKDAVTVSRLTGFVWMKDRFYMQFQKCSDSFGRGLNKENKT